MADLVSISDSTLSAQISAAGAELQRLQDRDGSDLLWNGDPAVWAGRAPLLFPLVGETKDRKIKVDGEIFDIPRHGFARTSRFTLVTAEKAHCVWRLDASDAPDGYNVGFNAGAAAGQTVMHLHVHVIPRFVGDMDDPRGGVRHVIPSRGNYLHTTPPLASGGEDDPFAAHVLPLLARARRVDIVSAFVQASGLKRIQHSLEIALREDAVVRIITGDYFEITQVEALELLLDWQATRGGCGTLEARVIEVAALPGRTRSFHPKAWHLEGRNFGVAFVGSSNLSLSALDTGIEWNLRVDRDADARAWGRIRDAFDTLWVCCQTARRSMDRGLRRPGPRPPCRGAARRGRGRPAHAARRPARRTARGAHKPTGDP